MSKRDTVKKPSQSNRNQDKSNNLHIRTLETTKIKYLQPF